MLIILSLNATGTHLVGGEIFYDHLGNNEYRITLIVYRDCGPTNSNNTQFDNLAPIAVYNNGNLVTSFNVQKSPSVLVPLNTSNPCLVAPPSACVEEARYISTIILPPISGGYDIAYQRCCRNPSTQNILNPNSQGSTYLTHIPGPSNQAVNSAPRFLNYPPTVLCANNAFNFDHSATDPDGDSLVYELCTPFAGASAQNPAPTAGPPPYSNVVWANGYTVNYQIQGSPSLSIDSQTGELSGYPTLQGIFTFGISVKEYRDGILLNESRRDFQFWVTNCDPLLLAGIPAQTDSCASYTVSFTNNSVGASFYEWNFGDGTTSTQVNPTHTFSAPGTYDITLIANPGWTCADTTMVQYTVKEPLQVDFTRPSPQCVTGNQFQFSAIGNFDNTASVFWNFGALASPQTSSIPSPSGVVYSDSGKHIVSVIVDQEGCTAQYSDTIFVIPEPEIGFVPPDLEGCAPYLAHFTDTSHSWISLNYLWQFGNGESSIDQNPSTLFTDTGYYDVTLTIEADSGCTSPKTLHFDDLIHVFPSPVAEFAISPKETDVFQPFFNITDQSYNGVTEMYYLDATGDTLILGNDGKYIVNDTGWVNIVQWVYNEFGCPDSATSEIYIKPVTTIYAPNSFTPDNDGLNDIWLPQLRDVQKYDLKIFNRWGQIIFQTNDQNSGWDGRFKDQESPSDIYVYKIRYQAVNKINRDVFGHITLIR